MKISKRQLLKIIREEYGAGEDEYSRHDGHRTGDVDGHYKDYEGPEGGNRGDHSKTDPDHLDYEGDDRSVERKAKTALAAIQDLASAAGVELTGADASEAMGKGTASLAMESRIKRHLRRIVRETRRLNEDEIDTELDRLHKNIKDDIDHIKDLKRDIESDREEEKRADSAEERKDEALRRKIRRAIKEAGQPNHQYQPSVSPTGVVEVEWDFDTDMDDDGEWESLTYQEKMVQASIPAAIDIPPEVMEDYAVESRGYGEEEASSIIDEWLSEEFGWLHQGWSWV